MSLHIYSANSQPATRFTDPNLNEPGKRRHWFHYDPRDQLWCWSCHRRRWAANLIAKVYYDCTQFYCRDGVGCKAPGWKKRRGSR